MVILWKWWFSLSKTYDSEDRGFPKSMKNHIKNLLKNMLEKVVQKSRKNTKKGAQKGAKMHKNQ